MYRLMGYEWKLAYLKNKESVIIFADQPGGRCSSALRWLVRVLRRRRRRFRRRLSVASPSSAPSRSAYIPASFFRRSTIGPIAYALTVLLWSTHGETFKGRSQSQKMCPMICFRFSMGSPRSNGFSPGWVRKIANIRVLLVDWLLYVFMLAVLLRLLDVVDWGSASGSESEDVGLAGVEDGTVDCSGGNVTVGKVSAHWPTLLWLVRRSYSCGLIYMASVQTLECLLRFSIVVQLMEASCSDVPLMPPEKRKNKAPLA